jgi:hypothetical protein
MQGFEDRERTAEAIFAHDLESDFLARMTRVKALGDWACTTMAASPERAAHYQEILHRIAVSTPDDGVLVARVRDDLAAAGVAVPSQRIAEILARPEPAP